MKIAVVGGGISGILTAYLLQQNHQVVLFEKNAYTGGHTNTIVIPSGPDQGLPVDTGFIVFNEKTYPVFIRFLTRLGVSFHKTGMSFSYCCQRTGQVFASRNLNTLFARRSNLLRPGYWLFVRGMVRFLETIRADYLSGRLPDITLAAYLKQNGFSDNVMNWFVVPMAAAIWSASDARILGFPVRAFAQFYENHGLLTVRNHPAWYFVGGGSHSYVNAFLKSFTGQVMNRRPVGQIKRNEGGVTLTLSDGEKLDFDKVVVATHADEALALLSDPTPDENRLLSAWRYSRNYTVLHTDASLMPPNRVAWASWNYLRAAEEGGDRPITVTYHMNRLQKLKTSTDYFVTLNPVRPIPGQYVITTIDYTHPIYDEAAFATQAELDTLNDRCHTFFCGSYFGYGFHEDGARSALNVGRYFDVTL